MISPFSYHQINENSLLVQINSENDALRLRAFIEQKILTAFEGEVTINHGFEEVLVVFKNCDMDHRLIAKIKGLLSDPKAVALKKGTSWRLPLFYDRESDDMKELSRVLNLSFSQIIDLHSNSVYQVSFMGFLPGFPYLEGLPQELHIPRKATPSLKVEKGSVAIAAGICGIYPQQSPGGWYVIGNCPIALFDKIRTPDFLMQTHDQVEFYEVDKAQHKQFLSEENLHLKQFING